MVVSRDGVSRSRGFNGVQRESPFVPKLDDFREQPFRVSLRPRGRCIFPKQIVLLVGTQQFALVGILLNPVDRVDETFLIVGRKLVVRHIVEQAFEIVGGSDFALDNAFVDQLRPHVLQDANHGLEPFSG